MGILCKIGTHVLIYLIKHFKLKFFQTETFPKFIHFSGIKVMKILAFQLKLSQSWLKTNLRLLKYKYLSGQNNTFGMFFWIENNIRILLQPCIRYLSVSEQKEDYWVWGASLTEPVWSRIAQPPYEIEARYIFFSCLSLARKARSHGCTFDPGVGFFPTFGHIWCHMSSLFRRTSSSSVVFVLHWN